MTDKEELKGIRRLADAMYYAAQYLTTDASRLHKAMDEYHQFIIHEWREEPVSRDYREIYKNIAQSDAFKSAYENKSLGEVMSVEGEEPVSDDLSPENFIKDYTKGCSNLIEYNCGEVLYQPWLTPEDAMKAVEIAREEMIEWIEDNIGEYCYGNYLGFSAISIENIDFFNQKLFISDLRKAMKDE